MCQSQHDEAEAHFHCCPSGGKVQGFIRPWLLLLLADKPTHGYELMASLAQDDTSPTADAGLLYRTLRQMEKDGMIRSSWDTGGQGPARRVYELTSDGVDHLHQWAVRIRHTRARLDRFLGEYERRIEVLEAAIGH